MIRAERVEIVEKMQGIFEGAPHVILAKFSGLTANQSTELRAKIREIGGTYTVIKNRLAKRAAEGTAAGKLAEQFSGPCAVATHADDPVILAKTLEAFVKDNPQVELLAGVVDSKDVVDSAGVKQLAELPGLPELRAQLLAMFNAPATKLVRLLNTPGTQLARVIDAHREQQEGGSEG